LAVLGQGVQGAQHLLGDGLEAEGALVELHLAGWRRDMSSRSFTMRSMRSALRSHIWTARRWASEMGPSFSRPIMAR
jgi:hypothetical protein